MGLKRKAEILRSLPRFIALPVGVAVSTRARKGARILKKVLFEKNPAIGSKFVAAKVRRLPDGRTHIHILGNPKLKRKSKQPLGYRIGGPARKRSGYRRARKAGRVR